MSSMVVADAKPGLRSRSPEACQRVAVQSLRRLLRSRSVAAEDDGAALPFSAGMVVAETAFQAFLTSARQVQGVRAPNLGAPGSLNPTKDECRLLRALAAAHVGDWPVLDNYLYKFALDRKQRVGLAEAVCALAAALAASGFMLQAVPTSSIPASALRVAFLRGLPLDEIEVAWPGIPPGCARCGRH